MPLLTCIFLLFLRCREKERMRPGAPGRRTPSARCSLTLQMHLHEYVQRNLAGATRKRQVHAHHNVASDCERVPPAATTPTGRVRALRLLAAAQCPRLAPHDGPVLGPDQHEPGEPGRLEPLQLRAELPAPPH